MKALWQRNQQIFAADELKVGDQRMILWIEREICALDGGHWFGVDLCFIRSKMLQRRIPKIGDYFAIIDMRMIVMIHFDRMRSHNPISCVLSWQVWWWSAPEIARIRCRCCEQNDCHEPRGWHFAQENDEHRSELPFSETAQHFRDGINSISPCGWWCCHDEVLSAWCRSPQIHKVYRNETTATKSSANSTMSPS